MVFLAGDQVGELERESSSGATYQDGQKQAGRVRTLSGQLEKQQAGKGGRKSPISIGSCVLLHHFRPLSVVSCKRVRKENVVFIAVRWFHQKQQPNQSATANAFVSRHFGSSLHCRDKLQAKQTHLHEWEVEYKRAPMHVVHWGRGTLQPHWRRMLPPMMAHKFAAKRRCLAHPSGPLSNVGEGGLQSLVVRALRLARSCSARRQRLPND